MLQGQTYTVMLPFTSTSRWNFVACSDHDGVTKCKGSQINITCKHCRGLGSISRPSDYEKSVLTYCLERCTVSRKSAKGICQYRTHFVQVKPLKMLNTKFCWRILGPFMDFWGFLRPCKAMHQVKKQQIKVKFWIWA